ncbi:MAG: DUF3313 family protein [Ramlibacter sp.]|nr:DUF3313 family protein [Ramlibacter sp.]
MKRLTAAALTALALLAAPLAQAQPAAVSPEGLKLVPNAKVQVLYLREGADFSGYDKFAILEAYVAFRKNWKRDQNSGSASAMRVTDSDMMRIKEGLAKQFKAVFVRELTAKGQKHVTAAGPGVLILRPALVNLDITAPDTMTARSNTYSVSTGKVTLILEVYDSVSSELLARVVDTGVATDSIMMSRNGMSNKADSEAILKKWAVMLANGLAQARGK